MADDPVQRPISARVVASRMARHSGLARLRRRMGQVGAVGIVVGGLALGATRLPASANWLNRVLLSPQRPFVVEDRYGRHATLADALAIAPSGSTIVVHREGPWALHNLVVAEGESFTIRAAASVRPRFIVENTEEPGLVSWGDLTLEGLTFLRAEGEADTHGILEAHGGTLTLRHCELRASNTAGLRANPPAVIFVRDDARLRVEDSVILGYWVAPISIRADGAGHRPMVDLENAVLFGFPVIGIQCGAGTTVGLRGVSATLAAPVLIGIAPNRELPRIDADFARCLLRAERAIWWVPGGSSGRLGEVLRWRGEGNYFAPTSGFVTTATRPVQPRSSMVVPELEDWTALPDVIERNPVTTPVPGTRQAEAAFHGRPITDLSREEISRMALPWREQLPEIGADLDTVWP